MDSLFRPMFAWIDAIFFKALKFFYSVFFDVASYNIFSTQTVYKVFSRVQLIIGVFMLFQFALTILRGIIEPEGVIGGKDGGNARKIIVRIITCIALLAMLYPVRINKSSMNEYEKQINNNGLLFGTLNSLQYRILSSNTIGKLILGPTRASDVDYVGDENEDGFVKSSEAAETFATSMFKAFYPINMDDNGKYICNTKSWIDAYEASDATIDDIKGLVDKKCSGGYFIDQNGIISIFCAIFFMFVFVSMSIDVVIRMFKLAILRIISPIPVISYMNPNGKKDGAFGAWTKILTSTYLDLFIRLATVYMILFIIAEFSNSDSVGGINFISARSTTGNGGVWSTIIIIIGLFAFAKQAPKFVRQALGLKEEGNGLFSGLGEILAVGAAASGIVGGAISRASASYQKNSSVSPDKKGLNIGKSILAGFAGGIGGGFNSGKAFFGSDKADAKSIMNANRGYYSKNYSNAADDSTFFGRKKAGLQSAFGLKNQMQKFDDQVKAYDSASAAMKRVGNILDNDGRVFKHFNHAITENGEILIDNSNGKNYSIKDLKDLNDRVQASSKYSIQTKEKIAQAYKEAQADRVRTIVSVNRDSLKNADDLSIYDSLKTISAVAHKYGKDGGKEFIDPDTGNLMNAATQDFSSTSWGAFKQAAGAADRRSSQIKASDEYAQAKGNAERAEQNTKK